jgi:hypothetical protein
MIQITKDDDDIHKKNDKTRKCQVRAIKRRQVDSNVTLNKNQQANKMRLFHQIRYTETILTKIESMVNSRVDRIYNTMSTILELSYHLTRKLI